MEELETKLKEETSYSTTTIDYDNNDDDDNRVESDVGAAKQMRRRPSY
jgi:hypothetical protein